MNPPPGPPPPPPPPPPPQSNQSNQSEQSQSHSSDYAPSDQSQSHSSDYAPSVQSQSRSSDYAPYPKLDPNDVAPPPPAPPLAGGSATTMPTESNPYVSPAPVPASSVKATMDSVKDVLEKWGKKAAEATKKGQDYAGNVWQHLKTGPSLADTAVGRIAQGTKVLAEGGYEKIFRQTFETVPEEQLLKSYACYLSTSAGPVMGVLYMSSAKLAFCSDNPLSYKVGEETQWSYYKVVIPFHQLKAVNATKSKVNSAEKYIQVISVDSHEFWFMGFVNYDSAVKNLQGALQSRQL